MGFTNGFALMLERPRKVRCIECFYVHQEDKNKEHYFCLKVRDYIKHEIDRKIGCNEYKPLSSSQPRRR